jgi:hypothetical protein
MRQGGAGKGIASRPICLVFYLASKGMHLVGLGAGVSNFDVLQATRLVVLVAGASEGCILVQVG